jgi:hypothetical protein
VKKMADCNCQSVSPVNDDTEESCKSVFYQTEKVCVPVQVKPYAIPGVATATCCNEPTVSKGTTCTGNAASCSFTVTQELCIAVPISFGAEITTGTVALECGEVSETGCQCGESESE